MCFNSYEKHQVQVSSSHKHMFFTYTTTTKTNCHCTHVIQNRRCWFGVLLPAHGEIQPYSQVLLQAHSADAVNSPLWHQHSLLILAVLTLELQCACLPCIMEELWTVTACPLSRHTGLLTVSDMS